MQATGMIGTDSEKGFIAQTPLGRTGKPDGIGDVVVFLASNESRWLTGENLVVSGAAPLTAVALLQTGDKVMT
jgi:3-oxoacyl-[acyl-carrier protein] reductase